MNTRGFIEMNVVGGVIYRDRFFHQNSFVVLFLSFLFTFFRRGARDFVRRKWVRLSVINRHGKGLSLFDL